MAKELKELTTRSVNYSQWYQDSVNQSGSGREFCSTRLYGDQALRICNLGKMQRILDDMFKETGHVNAYFPLLIPKSFLSKGSRTCRRLRQRMCRCNTLSSENKS